MVFIGIVVNGELHLPQWLQKIVLSGDTVAILACESTLCDDFTAQHIEIAQLHISQNICVLLNVANLLMDIEEDINCDISSNMCELVMC